MTKVNEVKRVPVIECVTDGQGLTLTCVTGESMRVDVSGLAQVIIEAATVHGLKQKLIDAAAISRNPDTGKSASPEDKWAAVVAVAERLRRGEWNAVRGEGGVGAGSGLLFRALTRMYPGKTAEQLRMFLDGKSKAEQAALRLNPKVAEVIETLKAEGAKAGGVDSDGLLGELGD